MVAMVAGRRFRTPGVSGREADQRFSRIEDLWRDNEAFCRNTRQDPVWTDVALWAADWLRKGEMRVVLPPLDDLLASYGDGDPTVGHAASRAVALQGSKSGSEGRQLGDNRFRFASTGLNSCSGRGRK